MSSFIKQLSKRTQFLLALGLSSLVGVLLFFYSAALGHDYQYSYLLWNLFLAWLPLVFAFWLVQLLKTKLWSSWEALGVTLLWLLFLPNSFYMISDFIHIQTAPPEQIVYYAVMFTSIIYSAVLLGFVSLYLVHRELKKRLTDYQSLLIIGIVIMVCCIAIYTGRDLRWNSWDVLTNPGGLLFDLSDQFLHFGFYGTALSTISTFFILISSMYLVAWSGIKMLRR